MTAQLYLKIASVTFGVFRDPVPTIAKIMGHDSIEQCLKYLGIDLDDMTSAMNAFSLG